MTTSPTLFTIGCARSSAERFFARLGDAGVTAVVDVRRQNTSQLAGFSKAGDLAWLLSRLLDVGYAHRRDLAPPADPLAAWRAKEITFEELACAYARHLTALPPSALAPDAVGVGERVALLCSEAAPAHCHRRLLAEHLAARWGGIEVVHL